MSRVSTGTLAHAEIERGSDSQLGPLNANGLAWYFADSARNTSFVEAAVPIELEGNGATADSPNREEPLTGAAVRPEVPRTAPATGERFREKAYLAIIVAMLSLVSAGVGSVVTFRLDESKWQRETTFGLRREVFAKRMELLERTVKVFNQLQ